MGGTSKVEDIKSMIRSEKPVIPMIQETNMVKEVVMALSQLHWRSYQGRAIRSKGASGGITTFHNAEKYVVKLVKESNHWLLTELQCREKLEYIFVSNIYGATHYRDKLIFWETLNSLREILQGKYTILVGDFNAIKS